MPQFTIPAGSMTRAVSSIGQALFPSGAGEIQGQLDGAQLNQRLAAADASTAQAALRNAEAERAAFEMAGAQAVRDFFGPNGPGAGTPLSPEALAPLMGNLLTMNDDPLAAVQAGTGANIAVNPQLYNPSDLSNVLIGTGIQSDFADTPAGFNAELTEDARQSDLGRIFEYDELLLNDATERREQDMRFGSPGNPLPLSVDDSIAIAEQFADQAEAFNLDLDDEEMAAAGQRVVDLYNATQDPGTAIQQTIREFMQAEELAAQNRSGGVFGLGADTPSSLDFVPFDVEQLGQPAQQEQPATVSPEQASLTDAWSATSDRPPQEGDTLRDQNGAPIYEFVGGQWVPFMQSAVATSSAIPRQFGPPYTPPTQEAQRRGDRTRRQAPGDPSQPTQRGDRRDRRDEAQGATSLMDVFSEGGTSYERNPRRGQ